MLKKLFCTLTVTVLFVLASALAYAQSSVTKFEIGAQISVNRLRDLSETDTGYGIRAGYNITNSIAIDTEFNYFPKDLNDAGAAGLTYSNNRTQGLFGVKYMALRGDKMAIGGKFRPGFVRFNGNGAYTTSGACNFLGSINNPNLDPFCQISAGSTKFAMDFGGVFEYYPSKRMTFRFDVGDTVIRFGQTALFDGFNSNNLQISAGVGFRF